MNDSIDPASSRSDLARVLNIPANMPVLQRQRGYLNKRRRQRRITKLRMTRAQCDEDKK